MRSIAQPVRVLMVSHYFAGRGGGIELVAAALAVALASRGFEIVWCATGAADDAAHSRYCRIPLGSSAAAEKLLGIPYPLLYPSAWRTIFREAGRADVVLIHDALYLTSIVAYVAARICRKPIVLVQHVGVVPYRSIFLRTLMRAANCCIAQPLLRRAERVIFISRLTQRHFMRIAWRRPPVVVFNGVDAQVFTPALSQDEVAAARRSLGLPLQAKVALFVGRFVEKKGLVVLERLARLRTDVLFTFAGTGNLDPDAWQLPNTRVYTGLSGPSLAPLYRASDLLLLPSAGEGFPLVIQEALASGLPIICGSDTASADPAAAPFLQAVDVELRDPEATARRFSAEINRILERAETAADRRARRAFALARYSWTSSAEAYAKILRELCLANRLDRDTAGVIDPAEEK
jgi:glycosyltransferase involved in cell wall biosynthesis